MTRAARVAALQLMFDGSGLSYLDAIKMIRAIYGRLALKGTK